MRRFRGWRAAWALEAEEGRRRIQLPASLLALALAVLTGGCQNERASPPPASPSPASPPRPALPTFAKPTKIGEPAKLASGLVYETLEEGTGLQAKSGDTVTIHCIASSDGGKPFFSTREANRPVTFKLGDSRLIQGWNEGIAGMKVGERRKVTMPPNLAYGALGRLPVIPPNGSLTLDIEALAFGEPPADLQAQDLGFKFTVPSEADLSSGRNEWLDPSPKEEKTKEEKKNGSG